MQLQLQDISEPKTTGPNTNPSELQSAAKAGFRAMSSLCNLHALATPGHLRAQNNRAQDEPLRAPECCQGRFQNSFLVYAMYMQLQLQDIAEPKTTGPECCQGRFQNNF